MKRFSSVVTVILCLGFCVQTTSLFAQIIRSCGTQAAFEKFKRGEKLLRPPSGPLLIYTPHFVIHYDTTGANACSQVYAESTAFFAEYAWAKFIGGLGLAAAPPDTGGPDSRYDIYLRYFPPPVTGTTYLESPYPIPYPDGYTTYIEVLSNGTWHDLRYTVVHEFFHGVQFRYSSEYCWWYENSATLMEQISEVPGGDDLWWVEFWFSAVTTNPLTCPYYPINTFGFYHYPGYLWPRFLCDFYSITTHRLIWEEIGVVPGENVLPAIDTVLKLYDSNLKQALGSYAVWRYFTGTRADTIHYFKYSQLMPTSFVDSIHRHQGPGSGNQGSYAPQGPGGTSFIEFYTTPDYLLKNSFNGTPYGEWQVSHIGYRGPSGHKQYLMDTTDFWSVLPTMSHDTFVLIPTVGNQYGVGEDYNYSGTAIASNPSPPQAPELQVCSILTPIDTIVPYTDVTPSSIRRNNGTSAVDSTWTSFYIGNVYSDSRKIGPLEPGQSDTITYANWTAKERKSFEVRCVAGGSYDVNRANNCCTTSVLVTLNDVEILEILSPRGVTTQNVSVTPRVRLRNNGTSGANVSVSFVMPNYTDTRSIYLGSGLSGDISFNNWTPTQLGECTTRARITIPDQRPFNDSLNGLVAVVPPPSIKENNLTELSFHFAVTPNPFTNSINIKYTVPIASQSSIRLFDVTGSLKEDICDERQRAGIYVKTLSTKNFTDGIYFLVMRTRNYREIKKIVKTK